MTVARERAMRYIRLRDLHTLSIHYNVCTLEKEKITTFAK